MARKDSKEKTVIDVIKKIRNTSEYFLDITDLIERSATYKTRQYIKLSDVEIKKLITDGKDAILAIIRNAICYEVILEDNGLTKESMEYIQEVISEVKKLIEKKA